MRHRFLFAVLVTALALTAGLAGTPRHASSDPAPQEHPSGGDRSVSVEKPPSAGDGQHQAAGVELKHPLRVRVTSAGGQPLAGRIVRFSIASAPPGARNAYLAVEEVRTDSDGYAETRLRLGSEPGDYFVTASVPGVSGAAAVLFTATARDSKWVLSLTVGLVGGLAFFLFGLRVMSDGMKKTAARRIRAVLSTLTSNRFVAVGAGAFVTVLIQSSSATTVMLVSFVRAGLMKFSQSIGMILGADIGTTVTAQLIAFKFTDYALLMIGGGVALMLISKREKPRDIGETIFGFGMLFFGMHVMSESMAPLQNHEEFVGLLVSLENPVVGILVGTAFTAVIQSSAAFIGILIVLATQGLLTLEAGIPLMLGANVGTCVTALLAGIGTNREARRVALTHVLIKVVGVLLFVGWIPRFAGLVRMISPHGDPSLTGAAQLAEVLPRQIANAHTVFNFALTLVMLPFTNLIARAVTKLLPDRPELEKAPYHTRHIDKALLSTPALALNLAKAEVLHMGRIVESMVEKTIRPFTDRDRAVVRELEREEIKVNYLQDEIQAYLGNISRQSLAEDRIPEVFQMMYTTTELEQIGDIVARNLVPRAKEWLDTDLRFSDEGRKELLDYHLRTVKQLDRALNVFQDVNLQAASAMKKKHKKYRDMEEQYMRSHFDRIRRHVPGTLETSEYHQELMEQFRRITSHSTRIGRVMLSWTKEMLAGLEAKSPPQPQRERASRDGSP